MIIIGINYLWDIVQGWLDILRWVFFPWLLANRIGSSWFPPPNPNYFISYSLKGINQLRVLLIWISMNWNGKMDATYPMMDLLFVLSIEFAFRSSLIQWNEIRKDIKEIAANQQINKNIPQQGFAIQRRIVQYGGMQQKVLDKLYGYQIVAGRLEGYNLLNDSGCHLVFLKVDEWFGRFFAVAEKVWIAIVDEYQIGKEYAYRRSNSQRKDLNKLFFYIDRGELERMIGGWVDQRELYKDHFSYQYRERKGALQFPIYYGNYGNCCSYSSG